MIHTVVFTMLVGGFGLHPKLHSACICQGKKYQLCIIDEVKIKNKKVNYIYLTDQYDTPMYGRVTVMCMKRKDK